MLAAAGVEAIALPGPYRPAPNGEDICIFAALAGDVDDVARLAVTSLEAEPAPLAPTTYGIGDALLTTYVLPFELASVVLLAALIAAVMLSRKEIRE